jgi:pyrroline-5-carboxylate reductase
MKIAFIGAGNMGAALAKAASLQKCELFIYDKDEEKARILSKNISANISKSVSDAIELADFVFLAVKPNVVSSVLEQIYASLSKNPDTVVVSMAAGVKIESLEKLLPKEQPVIRIMPNTPALVGCGMTVYSKNAYVSDTKISDFLLLMSASGTVLPIDEELIDAETAVAGCGPAFAYMFIDALKKAGVKCGLADGDALRYAAQTVLGAAQMVLLTNEDPELLTERVCSPGGSTIEGVKSLQNAELDRVLENAVKASFEKTKMLGMK